MSPLEAVLAHAHSAHCRPWLCREVVWLEDDRAVRELDRATLAAGRLLSEVKSIRRCDAGPCPDSGEGAGRLRPFIVRWSPKRPR